MKFSWNGMTIISNISTYRLLNHLITFKSREWNDLRVGVRALHCTCTFMIILKLDTSPYRIFCFLEHSAQAVFAVTVLSFTTYFNNLPIISFTKSWLWLCCRNVQVWRSKYNYLFEPLEIQERLIWHYLNKHQNEGIIIIHSFHYLYG